MDLKKEQERLKGLLRDFSEKICGEFQSNDIFLQIREQWGVGEKFFDMFWWDIKINPNNLPDEYREYTDIILSPERIDRGIVEQCGQIVNKSKVVVNKESWGNTKGKTHIDYSTGNIHRSDWTKNIWGGDERAILKWDGNIRQLILVKSKDNGHLGPRIAYAKGDQQTGFEGKDDYLIYQKEGKVRCNWISKVVVPKKCYYPQIFENKQISVRNYAEIIRLIEKDWLVF